MRSRDEPALLFDRICEVLGASSSELGTRDAWSAIFNRVSLERDRVAWRTGCSMRPRSASSGLVARTVKSARPASKFQGMVLVSFIDAMHVAPRLSHRCAHDRQTCYLASHDL